MCTTGIVKDCQVTSTSSSKCLRPLFIRCENEFGGFCNCEVAIHEPKPYPHFTGSECQLNIAILKRSLPTKEFRLFWKIPADEECPRGEGEPEYTCDCKEGGASCDYILGAKCSGGPALDCYVPPGICCNKKMGICDCDRSQGWVWAKEGLGGDTCQRIPGAACRKTENCVKGSTCTGGKCSSCPGTQTVDWTAGKCALNVMEAYGDGKGDCPQGTECRHDKDKQGHVCHCDKSAVEHDPKINECVATVGGDCDHIYNGYSRNCKTGDATVCEYNRYHDRHACVCDEKLGLASYGKFSSSECLVIHNHPCKSGGTKCLQDDWYSRESLRWQCLKSKGNGDQYTCVDSTKKNPNGEDEDWDDNLGDRKRKSRGNGHCNIIGSVAVVEFGLAVVIAAISALNC